jgi:prepilin peptidase CpaA
MGFVLVRAILWTVALCILAAATVVDLRRRIIPDEASAAIAVSGFALSLLVRPGSAWISLAGAVALLIALGQAARFRLIGGGDAKLIAAVSLLVPPEKIGALLLAIAFAGGMFSLVYLALRRLLRGRKRAPPALADLGAFGRFVRAEYARIRLACTVPYSLAVFAGVVAYVLSEYPQCLSETHCLL